MEYFEAFSSDEMQTDLTDSYAGAAEEGGVKELDIIHLFGKEKLEDIQRRLSKATGLAFVTVDFKGEPITEPTSFSHFCQAVRRDPVAFERCKSSDAFGSIQAAVTKRTNVYFCPCGLMEVAIPIIVRGHYLGGFIGGQIRCNDAPESVSRLSSVMRSAQSDEAIAKFQGLMEEIPVHSYEKFMDIANLVFLVINQLSENELSQHMQEEALKKRIKKMQALNQHYLKENQQKSREIQALKIDSNPYEMLDIFTALVNLTVIEDAPQTNELLTSFISYMKYKYMEKGTFVSIGEEIDQAERYLAFQKKKLGDRLNFSIQLRKEMPIQKIPANVLIPFVQNAVYNGIMLKREGGEVKITGSASNNKLVIEITDTGLGLDQEELDIKYETYGDMHEGYYIKLGMDYARETMRRLYGDKFEVLVENNRNKGSRSILIWPEQYDERSE